MSRGSKNWVDWQGISEDGKKKPLPPGSLGGGHGPQGPFRRFAGRKPLREHFFSR